MPKLTFTIDEESQTITGAGYTTVLMNHPQEVQQQPAKLPPEVWEAFIASVVSFILAIMRNRQRPTGGKHSGSTPASPYPERRREDQGQLADVLEPDDGTGNELDQDDGTGNELDQDDGDQDDGDQDDQEPADGHSPEPAAPNRQQPPASAEPRKQQPAPKTPSKPKHPAQIKPGPGASPGFNKPRR